MKEGLAVPADGLDVDCEQKKGLKMIHRMRTEVSIYEFPEMDKIGGGAGCLGVRT